KKPDEAGVKTLFESTYFTKNKTNNKLLSQLDSMRKYFSYYMQLKQKQNNPQEILSDDFEERCQKFLWVHRFNKCIVQSGKIKNDFSRPSIQSVRNLLSLRYLNNRIYLSHQTE